MGLYSALLILFDMHVDKGCYHPINGTGNYRHFAVHLVFSVIYGLMLVPGEADFWFGLGELIKPLKKFCWFLMNRKFLVVMNSWYGLCQLERMGQSKLNLIWCSIFTHNCLLHLYALYWYATKTKDEVPAGK